MRTSVEIPDTLLKQAKSLAQRKHTTVRELIIQGLRRVLEAEQAKPARFRLENHAVGSGGLVEGLSGTDWDEVRGRAYEGRGG